MTRALRTENAKAATSTAASTTPANPPTRMDAAATVAPATVTVIAISAQPRMLPLRFAKNCSQWREAGVIGKRSNRVRCTWLWFADTRITL